MIQVQRAAWVITDLKDLWVCPVALVQWEILVFAVKSDPKEIAASVDQLEPED